MPPNLTECTATLREITHVCEDIRIYKFVPEGGEVPFLFEAGQFVQMLFSVVQEDGSIKQERRSFSIASPPSQKDSLDFVIRILEDGACTPLLDAMKVGDSLKLRGPLGHFYMSRTQKEKVFIAAGTGIAPVLSMIWELEQTAQNIKQTLLYGVAHCRHRVMKEQLKAWGQHQDHAYIPVVSRDDPEDEHEQAGRVTDYIEELFSKEIDAREYYICGPPHMVVDVKKSLVALGATQIKIEAYD